MIGSFLPRIIAAYPSPDKPAVILFTSGTEGEPKGMVSHANILSNVGGCGAYVPSSRGAYVVFNPLPTFHSFGLDVSVALMPVVSWRSGGVSSDVRASRTRSSGSTWRTAPTVLLATDTFISQYM